MTDTAPAFVVSQLRAVLREAFEGPQAKWTYFIDNRPDAAVLGTVDGLSAEQASRSSGAGGTSIASHVHHLCFSLAASSAWIRGERRSGVDRLAFLFLSIGSSRATCTTMFRRSETR